MSVTSDNLARQCEELEALKSIYGDEWQEDGPKNTYCIALKEGPLCLELFVTLPEDYPERSPPLFQILAPALKRPEMVEITSLLQEVYLENIGETVIFQWIEKAREWLQDKSAHSSYQTPEEHDISPESDKCCGSTSNTFHNVDQNTSECSADSGIIHGDPVSFKKSTFQGHVAVVTNTEQVKSVISELKKNRKIANATHNIYAYRIYKEDSKCFIQDCEDDGEAQAGGRLLHLLQIMNIQNVVVVVSRWYGGVHLGPDRFRFINNSARQVIEKADLLSSTEQRKKK